MTDDINGEKDHEKLNQVLYKTLHRFKNNLQTQLSLMNIQTATKWLYFDEKKVIADRMFALTHVYDLYYSSNVDESLTNESQVSLQSLMFKLYEHIKSSTSKVDFNLTEISKLSVDLDNLLLLSYIIIEINDFSQALDDFLYLDINKKGKKLIFNFSLLNKKNHLKFVNFFKNQNKILDLLVIQLKGKIEYKKKFIKLSFPIL